MVVGILALQGAVEPHQTKLQSLGVSTLLVRTPEQLERVQAIILPGGESTTMLHLLQLNRLWDPLREFVKKRPTWGICAGSVLLANEVQHPTQESLRAMRITVVRNAYGRQQESFISPLTPLKDWVDAEPFEGVFIRAPRITHWDSSVRPLLAHGEEIVMVQEGHLLASTFHPELTSSSKVHEYFLKTV